MNEYVMFRGMMGEDYQIEHRVKIPRGADVLVVIEQVVAPLDELATYPSPGNHTIIDLSKRLGIPHKKIPRYLYVAAGDEFESGEVLARKKSVLGREKLVTAPFSGQVLEIENGVIFLESDRNFIDIPSPIPGKVAGIEPDDHIMIRTTGVCVDLAWGAGGTAWASLKILGPPEEKILVERLSLEHRGEIALIPSILTEELVERGSEIGVKGLIASSASSGLLPVLGDISFPVGLVHGFGEIPMDRTIFELLSSCQGKPTSLDTNSVDEWQGARPKIIIPLETSFADRNVSLGSPAVFQVGQIVRVVQEPFLGSIGKIVTLPKTPVMLPGGHYRFGAEITINQVKTFVPFENLEHIN